jgi:hypothetical protein
MLLVDLPYEIVFKIFKDLDAVGLSQVSEVSKVCNAIACDDVLWRYVAQKEGLGSWFLKTKKFSKAAYLDFNCAFVNHFFSVLKKANIRIQKVENVFVQKQKIEAYLKKHRVFLLQHFFHALRQKNLAQTAPLILAANPLVQHKHLHKFLSKQIGCQKIKYLLLSGVKPCNQCLNIALDSGRSFKTISMLVDFGAIPSEAARAHLTGKPQKMMGYLQ